MSNSLIPASLIPAPRTPVRARRLLAALIGCLTLAALPSPAGAIPYFNEPFGFDNSTLGLHVDWVIDPTATFDPIASGQPDWDIGLTTVEDVDDTASSIDRTITWTLINNAPTTVTEFLVFFTALGSTPYDYSGANIDLDIDAADAMDIISYGPYTFAGYHLTLADFSLVGGDLVATRTFRYTVDVPQHSSGPPYLGIARTSDFSVPEPATGLLFASALLVMAGSGRRRRS